VAAATAMWMKYMKHASPSLARLTLEKWARTDSYTALQGSLPNAVWGYGKLGAYNIFDHKAPTVSVTSPVGGELWKISTSNLITWTATDSLGVDSVRIDYSTDGGSTWIPVAANLANSGSYLWTVPGPTTIHALVKVTAIDPFLNRGTGQSPAQFTISVLVPVEMSGLAAEAGHGYVDVKWSAFFEGAAPSFQVLRSTAASGNYQAVSSVLAGGTQSSFSFRDDSALPGTEYYYRVGYGQGGSWNYTSPTRVVTPAAVFAIHSVAPNPTNGSARVRFEVARSGRATVVVYSLSGQKVRTLLDSTLQPGVSTVTWDGRTESGSRAAAGNYFVRVTSVGQSLSKTVTLIR